MKIVGAYPRVRPVELRVTKKKFIYRFNPHTLSYEKVTVTLKERLRKVSFTALSAVVLGVAIAVVIVLLIDSPKETALKREIAGYKRELRALESRVDRDSRVLQDLEQRDSAVYRTLLGAAPPRRSLRDPEPRGFEGLEGYDCKGEIARVTLKVDTLSQRLYAQSVSIDDVFKMAGSKQQRLAAMPAIMPIRKSECNIVSGYGMRYHPILHHRRMHTGIDLTAQQGTPVYATADGRVTTAGRGEGTSGYGICVVVDHGYGYQTLYGHLSKVAVKRGQKVKRGEMVGYVGHTGLAQGNHLHYEVIQNGNKVNPVYFFFNDLTPAEYEEVIEAANREGQCLS